MDRGGLILRDLSLWLIYWGRAWSGIIAPTASDITYAAQSIFAGTYFSGLGQYGGIRGGTLKGSIQVTHSDPPNPFSNAAIMGMIYQQLTTGALPAPDDDPTILYGVVLPPGINPIDRGTLQSVPSS